MYHFAKATPLGCIAGFFWLLFLAVDVLLYLAAYKLYHRQPLQDAPAEGYLAGAIVLSLLLLAALIPIVRRWLSSRAGRYSDGRGLSP